MTRTRRRDVLPVEIPVLKGESREAVGSEPIQPVRGPVSAYFLSLPIS